MQINQDCHGLLLPPSIWEANNNKTTQLLKITKCIGNTLDFAPNPKTKQIIHVLQAIQCKSSEVMWISISASQLRWCEFLPLFICWTVTVLSFGPYSSYFVGSVWPQPVYLNAVYFWVGSVWPPEVQIV